MFTSERDDELERIANEVAIASRMSNHKNVLELMVVLPRKRAALAGL